MCKISFSFLFVSWLTGIIVQENVSGALAQAPWIAALSRLHDETSTKAPRKWISDIFYEAEGNFNLNTEGVSDKCKRDFGIYETHAKNQTIWAVRMLESSEWPRMGIFSGVTMFLGNWEECLRSRGPEIQGQYCLVDANYGYSFAESDPLVEGWDDWPRENASAWGVIKMYEKILTRKSRRELTWAMCIPSSCKTTDLQNSVLRATKPVFQKYDISIDVNVNPINCRIQEETTYPTGFLLALAFIISIALLVASATLYEYFLKELASENQTKECEESSIAVQIFECFSAKKTWVVLNKHTSNTYTTIYTSKVICFFLIVIAHQGLLSYPFPKLGEENSELIYKPFKIGLGFHGVVDAFIMMSGFLTFHFGLEPTKQYGVIYYVISIVFRWLRLIPVMGLVILTMVYIMPQLGDGPLFNTHYMNEVQHCIDNWWTNILAINNVVNRKEMCLISTWYIAVDFQLTLLGGALLIILAYNYRLGILSIMLTFIGGILIAMHEIWANHLSGLPMPVLLDLDRMRRWPAFSDNYIQIFSRIGPYIMGCVFALVLKKLREKNYQPSIITTMFILSVCSIVGWGSQLYGFIFFIINRPYNGLENALYGVLHRVLVVLPTAVFIVLMSLRKIYIITDIFEFKIFLSLGRLCYCVYLVSFPIQMFYFSTFRQIIDGATNMDLFWRCMMDLATSLLVALVLFFLSEGPINSMTVLLQKYVIRRLKGPEKGPLTSITLACEKGVDNTSFSA